MLKKVLIIGCMTYALNLFASPAYTIKSKGLQISLDDKGEVTELINTKDNKNFIASVENENNRSYLIRCKTYSCKNQENPTSMKVLKKSGRSALLAFTFPSKVKLVVKAENKKDYIKLTLVKATPLKDIDTIYWGPYKTTMRGRVGQIIGLLRNKACSIGGLSLEPNTDGDHGRAANYENYGSFISLESLDQSHPRELRKWMTSKPIKVTVLGSSIALYGVPAGRKNELDMIEKIEIAEKLPHPIFQGKWNKRTTNVKKLSLWLGLSQSNADKEIELAKDLHAGTICRMHGYYSNWGHFDLDKNIFPGGYKALQELTQKAWDEAKVLNTTYTLTGFLKPMSEPEPFITPKPDSRLAKWDPTTSLAASVNQDAKELKIRVKEGVVDVIKASSYKVVCIDNEMIEYKSYKVKGKTVILQEAQRGAFKTKATPHKKKSKVKFMYVSGYHNFYPGTVGMNNEMAGYIARDMIKSGNRVLILDGHESCYETGHAQYALNIFPKVIYDKIGAKKDTLITYSITLGNYNWHMISYASWGEYQLEKGFRGTCLDYRINRQVEHQENLTPNKMGQYYPDDKTTIEDLEWLMARVCGWDSGVDFNLDYNRMHKNPNYKAFCKTLALWDKARAKNLFSEKQKMGLRQTDRLYHLSKTSSGKLKLKFVKRWQHKGVVIAPPSVIKIKRTSDAKVKKLSIDWSWSHNPAIFKECGVSNDLIFSSKNSENTWDVTLPKVKDDRERKSLALLPIVRVPSNAPCAVTDIHIGSNGGDMVLPITLKPGEYATLPHTTRWGCVYDAKTHKVKREFYLPQFNSCWYLPSLKRGEVSKIKVTAKPVKEGSVAKLIVNLRFWNEIMNN